MNSTTQASSWIGVRDTSTRPGGQLDNELKAERTAFLKDMAIALVIAAAVVRRSGGHTDVAIPSLGEQHERR